MCTETPSSAACSWIQSYISLADDEDNKDYEKFKGLIVSLPLLRPFSDTFVMQASLLNPPVHEVGEILRQKAVCKALWALPFISYTELKLARPRCQLTAAATNSHLHSNNK